MAHMLDLHSELLTTIITFLLMSTDDIRDWARATAVCKQIYAAAVQPNCLSLINCEPILTVTRPEQHQHINGLLSRCVQLGNPIADAVMAKVILFGGAPLWTKMRENDEATASIKSAIALPLSDRRSLAKSLITGSIADTPYILFSMEDEPSLCESYRRLHHLRMLKSLITLAGPFDLRSVFSHLQECIMILVGYTKFIESGIGDMLTKMCGYEDKMWPHMYWHKRMMWPYRRLGEPLADNTLKVSWATASLRANFPKYRDPVILALDNMIKM